MVLAGFVVGCGPQRIIIYPIKGCDYFKNPYHTGPTFYLPGPPSLGMNPYIKRCYADQG